MPGLAASSLMALGCADSAGRQGADHETVIGRVQGLALPGSNDPAGLYPIRASDGRRLLLQGLLAACASAASYAKVSIIRPADARLVYESASHVVSPADEHSFRSGAGRGFAEEVRLLVGGPALCHLRRRHHRPQPGLCNRRGLLAIGEDVTVAVPIGAGTC